MELSVRVQSSMAVSKSLLRTAFVGLTAVRQAKQMSKTGRSAQDCGQFMWQAGQELWAKPILNDIGVAVQTIDADEVNWNEPAIFVANHQSVVDILAMVAVVRNGRFVAKKEIRSYPFVGAAAQYGAQIIVDRSDHEKAMLTLRLGMKEWPDANLIFFAEGTRTRTGKLGEFKYGPFVMARELGLPIQPVAIGREAFAAVRRGNVYSFRGPREVTVEFGRRIKVQPASVLAKAMHGHDPFVEQLRDMTRAQIANMLQCTE